MDNENYFIVIEGLDGSGKTEITSRIARILQLTLPNKVNLTFEPHDPSCGGLYIRQTLMRGIKNPSPYTLALAFAVNRIDHCDRVVRPFLSKGKGNILICDRYYLSSLVYQSTPEIPMSQVMDLNRYALKPDITIFLNASNSVCFKRMKRRGEEKELFESKLSLTRTKYRKGIDFLRERGEIIFEVNADGSIHEVLKSIFEIIAAHGPKWLKIQPVLSEELLPEVFSLNGKNFKSISSIASKFAKNWENTAISSLQEFEELLHLIKQSIQNEVDKMEYNEMGTIFLQSLIEEGFSLGEKFPWSDMDAFRLEAELPLNIKQQGVAMMLGELQRYDSILKKVYSKQESYDFVIAFSPATYEKKAMYGREGLEFSKDISPISPSVRILNKEDIVKIVLFETINLFQDEYMNTISSHSELKNSLKEFRQEIKFSGTDEIERRQI